MSQEKKTGGPAFPQPIAEIQGGAATSLDFVDAVGMTLRDYFAAKALPAILNGMSVNAPAHAAQLAYQYADAMLAERDQ